MSAPARPVPIVLDAAAIEDLPEGPLGHLAGVRNRVVWQAGTCMAGLLTIDGGHQLGLHTHRRHHHHLWVVEGGARVLGRDLGPGSYVHVPSGAEHDIDARGTAGCAVFYLYSD